MFLSYELHNSGVIYAISLKNYTR